MSAESRRLSILSTSEIDDLYAMPRFTDEERRLYFDLSEAERAAAGAIRTASVAVHLILQLGYFKAKRQFFLYEFDQVADDIACILELYFPGRDIASVKMISKPTRLEQHQTILTLFNYRSCDSAAKADLERKTERIAMLSTQPLYILREALQYLSQLRIIAPPYRFMQEMVGRVVAGERKRVSELLNRAITPDVEALLDTLLRADERLYRITALKHEAKDFSYKELRREVERRKFFQPLYEFTRTFLAQAGLSAESGKYFASLVKFYTVYKLQRMPVATARLFLLCFAYHRFLQINDNLIEAFVHLVDQYESEAKSAAETAMQQAFIDATANLKAAGQVLTLFIDKSIGEDVPFAQVKEKAFSLLQPEQFAVVADYMRNIAFDKLAYQWNYYETLSGAFKRNLRHLFCELTFAGRVEHAPLMEAVSFMQDLLRQGKSPRQTKVSAFPTAIIPKNLNRYLYVVGDGKKKLLNADRYEFLVYRQLRNALEAGDIYVHDSTEFRRFEDDLISDDRWKNKDVILREIGSPILLTPIEMLLDQFHDAIEDKFAAVNQRIIDGENQHIKVRGAEAKRRWKLLYPSAEESTNHPFYGQLPGVGIADLLWFVAGETGFLKSFTHVLDRYVKHDPDPQEILAGIVAMGTNMGLWKMAEVSGLSHQSLSNSARNFLRLETLHAANDAITNAIAKLPAFRLFDIKDEMHSSSDGQHLETQIETINARHSPKYFGLKKGVTAYTLVANHVPINAKIIGTHEHESHYVFDLLYNNTSEIKPERHSTDTHGTNQLNFWILHAYGYAFAPRYRDLHKKIDSLIGFNSLGYYDENYLIKPARRVYDELIIKEWPNVLRIMASLGQKDVTQATIIRKLSSYTRQNQTKRALWELDNLCRTLYILEFIDDVGLRQRVQKALNRGEAYHRFRRAVAFVNGGKFRVQTEAEQQIWNECSRLITNAVIYYNTALLSRVYAQKERAGDQDAMDIISGMSPIAWQHINLFGSFEFNHSNSKVDLNALAARFEDPAFWNRALQELEEINLS